MHYRIYWYIDSYDLGLAANLWIKEVLWFSILFRENIFLNQACIPCRKQTCLFNFYCCFESKLHWIFYINYKHIVSLFFSFVSQRFCTCIRSYLQTKLSVFQVLFPHIFIYTTCCSNCCCYRCLNAFLVFRFKQKNEAKENAKDEVGNWGLFFCCIWCFMLLLLKDGWIGFMNVLPFHPNRFDEKNTFCSLQEATAAKEVVATDFFWHESISNSTKHKSWQIYIS